MTLLAQPVRRQDKQRFLVLEMMDGMTAQAPDTLFHVRLVAAHLMTSSTLHANLFIRHPRVGTNLGAVATAIDVGLPGAVATLTTAVLCILVAEKRFVGSLFQCGVQVVVTRLTCLGACISRGVFIRLILRIF